MNCTDARQLPARHEVLGRGRDHWMPYTGKGLKFSSQVNFTGWIQDRCITDNPGSADDKK